MHFMASFVVPKTRMLVLYVGKCSSSDFYLIHLERGHKVTVALNDLSRSINLTLEN